MKYLYLQSTMQEGGPLKEKADKLFNYIEENTGISLTKGSIDEVAKENIAIVYISSGGTAGDFKEALSSLSKQIVLVTSGSDNSLSASMEIMTYLANIDRSAKLLHGPQEEISTKLEHILSAVNAKDALNGLRLGLFGKPSDWLISASTDINLLKERFGIEVTDIPMEELLEEIGKKSYKDNEACRALKSMDFDKNEVEGALEIYGAFSRLVEKYKLDGFSVRCFDLLTNVKNSGCLGLAILNQEGIYSGCEGDLPSLISMAILGKISNKPVFQCNPSRVDSENDEIVFAHCTLPLNLPTSYKLDTHFESDMGVAIAGDIPSGPATIFKATGMLDRYFVSSANIEKSLHESNLCRSQILVHADEGVGKFFNTPVGNHYLICLGDYSDHLNEFFSLIGSN